MQIDGMEIDFTKQRGYFFQMDCMKALKQMPDKCIDLCICDPPYGIKRLKNPKGRLEKYGDTTQANNNVPTKEYFDELFRVSKNQVIWGGNYFELPPCRCFFAWYKHQPVENYSDVEFAWSSFDKPAKVIDLPYFGNIGADEQRIHTTQKPIKLYEWILTRYANKGDIILDTHTGSASSLIACNELGYNYIGFEIDEVYYRKAKERLERETAQMTIFDLMGGME